MCGIVGYTNAGKSTIMNMLLEHGAREVFTTAVGKA